MTPASTAHELSRAAARLADQVSHWTPPRWAASGRAEAFHALVQRIAALDADAEGEPRRRVPRLDNDLALPDQLRVVVADLLAASGDEPTLAAAVAAIAAARAALWPG